MRRTENDRANARSTARRSSALVELTGGRSASAARAPIAEDVTLPEPEADPPTAHPVAPVLTSSSLVEGAASAPTASLQRQWSIASRAAVKVDIASAGWYRVAQPTLVAAGLAIPADSRLLQLFVDGVEQPLRVNGAADGRFGPQDSVEFYATGADTPYTGDPHLLDSFR